MSFMVLCPSFLAWGGVGEGETDHGQSVHPETAPWDGWAKKIIIRLCVGPTWVLKDKKVTFLRAAAACASPLEKRQKGRRSIRKLFLGGFFPNFCPVRPFFAGEGETP